MLFYLARQRAWILEVCWLQVFQDYDRALVDPKATANFCWMSMIQQTTNKLHQQNGSKMVFTSCFCFLKGNSKPKSFVFELRVKLASVSWDQRGGHRTSALILLSFDFPQGTPFVGVNLFRWEKSWVGHPKNNSKFAPDPSPTGGKRAVSFRACIRSIHWVNVSKWLPNWFNEHLMNILMNKADRFILEQQSVFLK